MSEMKYKGFINTLNGWMETPQERIYKVFNVIKTNRWMEYEGGEGQSVGG